MSIEHPQNREAVFQSWLTKFQGKFWLNTEMMPEGVYVALQAYKHWKSNGEREEAAKKMEEAANNFEKLTGYNIQDFVKYQDEQNQKLRE